MALPGIYTSLLDGQLNQPAPGQDYVASIITLNTVGATISPTQIGSVAAMNNAGITTVSHPVLSYQITDYFDQFPNGLLYVANYPSVGTFTFNQVQAVQQFAQRSIRTFGVYASASFTTSHVTAAQTVCESLGDDRAYTQIILAYPSLPAHSSATDLTSLDSENVYVVSTYDDTQPALGSVVGLVSKRERVSDSFCWVETGNLTNSVTGKEKKYLGDGVSIDTLTNAELETYANRGYLIPRRFVGRAGTYLLESFGCTSLTSDFNRFEYVSTANKIRREIETAGQPLVKSRVTPAPGGKLSTGAIANIKSTLSVPLRQMRNNGEIGDSVVNIDPNQILSTSGGNLDVTVGYDRVDSLTRVYIKIKSTTL